MEFDLFDFLLTLNVFVTTLVLFPLIFFSYLFIKVTHNFWYCLISYLHPELNFVKDSTLRTLSDTHRNQGIIAVLLTLKGGANVEAVKRHLQEVVKRKNKQGDLVFPHLRENLVTRFGTYAWQNLNNFDLDQNLIVAPFTFRGRSVSELNIQDCVSDIISKYLPSGVPPWQLVVIPSSEHQHYILLRIHHVILGGGLNIADFLPLIPPVRSNAESAESKSPLRNVFKKPEHLPYLKERLTEDFTNRWNEFISNYDPLEKPELLKQTPGFFEFIAMLIITSVSTMKECRKGLPIIKTDIISRLTFLLQTIDRETSKRRINISTFVRSIFVTLDPRNIITFIIKYAWDISLKSTIKLPITIYNEIMALHTCISLQYCAYPNTTIGLIYNYVPLFYYAGKELFYCFKIIFHGPMNTLKEIFSSQDIIQTVTLCGRKVVAWSDPIKKSYVQEIAKRTNVSETEIVLAACSAAISRYFTQIHDTPPKEIAITARNINSNYIFSTGCNVKPADAVGGIVCLGLPILGSEKDASLLENLHVIKKNVAASLEKQPLTYLLSILQTKFGVLSKLFPATFIGIFLRCLSVKYGVCFTEVTSKQPNITQRTTWGEEVISSIYWRPPQANISISLCVNHYADHLVMGVMSDAQLVPHHPVLARGFVDHLEDLAMAAGVNY